MIRHPRFFLSYSGLAAGLLAALLGCLAGTSASARDGSAPKPVASPVTRIEATARDRLEARKIDLGTGKSIIVDLASDAKEVFVANPSVANAVIRSTRKLFIIGVSPGSTTIYITDGAGQQIAAVEVDVGRELGVLERSLRSAIPGSTISVTPVGDSIVLSGTVDNVLEAQRAVDIATAFVGTSFVGPPTIGGNGVTVSGGSNGAVITGKVINSMSIRARDQVMLKVTISEVKRNVLKQLGVNVNGTWNIAGNSVRLNSDPSMATNIQSVNPASTLGLGNNRQFDIKAAERQGVMRTLAEPILTAISGETAKFTAGGEIPVPTNLTCGSSRTNNGECGIQTTYKSYGVQLIFSPTVLSEGRISLRVATEVTDVDLSHPIIANGAMIPSFSVRKQDTTVELPSGGSLVTAGLIQQVSKQTISGMPGLMNIPILGSLFRSRDYQREETELMMIVTPYIAKPNSVAAIAQPDDGYADANDAQSILMGRLTRIYGVAGAPRTAQSYRGNYGFIHD